MPLPQIGIGDAAEDIVKTQPDETEGLTARVRSNDYSTRMVATLQSHADGHARRHPAEREEFREH